MNEQPQEVPSGGINIKDIYYVLFRRKWLILAFALVGIAACSGIWFLATPIYKSEAKVFIRYVLERKSFNPIDEDAQMKSPDFRGDNIINSEVEILTSLDLARDVVQTLGPDRILANVGGGSTNAAIGWVSAGLRVEASRRSNVLIVRYQHPDPTVVQSVLRQLIESYKKKHIEVHRAVGVMDEYLTQQADVFRGKLNITEDELKKLKAESGVISPEESKRVIIEEMSKVRQELFTAQAEMEQRKAAIRGLGIGNSNQSKNEQIANPDSSLPQEKIQEYLGILSQMSSLANKEAELMSTFTDANPVIKRHRFQMETMRQRKEELINEYPQLTGLAAQAKGTDGKTVDVNSGLASIASLEAKIKYFQAQMVILQTNAIKLDEVSAQIGQLERRRQMEDASYRSYSSSLEQARLDETLGPGRISNINVVQAPSLPTRDSSEIVKLAGGTGAVCIGLGLGLAFLLEFFFNPTIKRPSEIERKVKLPLFISIPAKALHSVVNKRAKQRLLSNSKLPSTESNFDYAEVTWKNGPRELAPWEANHPLRPYFDALRDRLVMDFELKGMHHNPKLVAVTSCHRGAGVSTIATGLAASLSETEGGNVLLVDMNSNQGAAQTLSHGRPGCNLPEIFEKEISNVPAVQGKLYLACASQESNRNGVRILPKGFAHLVPKMKASDYDYIIFDMPPVDQTSPTARLSGFVDSVVLVVESERTNLEAVKNVKSMLSRNKANLNAVMNKHKRYVPKALDPEG